MFLCREQIMIKQIKLNLKSFIFLVIKEDLICVPVLLLIMSLALSSLAHKKVDHF